MAQKNVERFSLQATKSFVEGAPQREEYESDVACDEDCDLYRAEWRTEYRHDGKCSDFACPQCGPTWYRCQFCARYADSKDWKDDTCPHCGAKYDAMLAQEGDD